MPHFKCFAVDKTVSFVALDPMVKNQKKCNKADFIFSIHLAYL